MDQNPKLRLDTLHNLQTILIWIKCIMIIPYKGIIYPMMFISLEITVSQKIMSPFMLPLYRYTIFICIQSCIIILWISSINLNFSPIRNTITIKIILSYIKKELTISILYIIRIIITSISMTVTTRIIYCSIIVIIITSPMTCF